MNKDVPHPSEEEIKAIAERRAASLKRIQELHHKASHEFPGPKGGKGPKQPPLAKGRTFRHQGR